MKLKMIAALSGALLATSMMTVAAKADGMPAAKGKSYSAPVVEERAPLISWSGFYVGANAGYQWDHTDWTAPVANTHVSPRNDSGIFGGHVGIQHQWGRIVVGVEASYSGPAGFGFSNPTTACPNTSFSCEARIDSLFLVGPRLGYAHDRWLGYVTGGYASARIDTQATRVTGGGAVVPDSVRHNGGFVGGGVEYMLHDRWIIGLEYIHTFLDTERHFTPNNVISVGNTRDVDGDQDILRARVSFKLGREDHQAAPMK